MGSVTGVRARTAAFVSLEVLPLPVHPPAARPGAHKRGIAMRLSPARANGRRLRHGFRRHLRGSPPFACEAGGDRSGGRTEWRWKVDGWAEERWRRSCRTGSGWKEPKLTRDHPQPTHHHHLQRQHPRSTSIFSPRGLRLHSPLPRELRRGSHAYIAICHEPEIRGSRGTDKSIC